LKRQIKKTGWIKQENHESSKEENIEPIARSIEQKGEKITAHNPQGKAWDTEGLPPGGTDLTKLLATLYGIKKAEAKAFIDENPKELKTYGLEDPRLTLTFVDDKNLQQVLLVGGKDKKLRGYYAKRRGDPNVFLLEEDFLDNIPAKTEDLRVTNK